MRGALSLDHLDPSTRQALTEAGPTIPVAERDFLLHDGESSRAVFFVVDGLLKVVKTSLEGKISFLGLRGPGSLVGELGILSGSPRTSALQAVRPSHVVRISEPTFERLLAERPDFSRALLEHVATKLREATSQIYELMSADATTRMAARLVQLAYDTIPAPDEHVTVVLPVSQQELGEWAGLSRAGAVNALRDLRDRGLIETSRMTIDIRDLDLLTSAAMT